MMWRYNPQVRICPGYTNASATEVSGYTFWATSLWATGFWADGFWA